MVKVKEELTGRRFGKLVVLEQSEDYVSPKGQHQAQWHCKCDCGNSVNIIGHNLLSKKRHLADAILQFANITLILKNLKKIFVMQLESSLDI